MEKTGIKLLKEFGTIEGIYDNIDKVGGKTKESLIEHKNTAFISRKLGEIIRNVPLNISIDELKVKDPNWEELVKLYQALEFKSLLAKIPRDKIRVDEDSPYESEYKIVEDDEYDPIIKEIEREKKFCFKFYLRITTILKVEFLV